MKWSILIPTVTFLVLCPWKLTDPAIATNGGCQYQPEHNQPSTTAPACPTTTTTTEKCWEDPVCPHPTTTSTSVPASSTTSAPTSTTSTTAPFITSSSSPATTSKPQPSSSTSPTTQFKAPGIVIIVGPQTSVAPTTPSTEPEPTPAGELPSTGAASFVIMWTAMVLLLIGVPTVWASRRWGQ